MANRPWLIAGLVLLVGCSSGDSSGSAAQPPDWTTGQWQRVCKYDREMVPELSGLVASARHPGVLWALSDSGNAPVLVALDAATCRVRGLATVPAANTDWEGLAAGARKGKPVLFISDTGNNLRDRGEVAIIEVSEPALGTTTTTAKVRPFSMPDGPVDIEWVIDAELRLWIVQVRPAVLPTSAIIPLDSHHFPLPNRQLVRGVSSQ